MKHSQKPLWKKSMLRTLNLDSILEFLEEIQNNGDVYGYEYEDDDSSQNGYYREYKEQFDDLSDGAYRLWDTLREHDIRENWDDMTVALLGETHKVLGFDSVQEDYYGMIGRWDEELAVEEAAKRIERLTKKDMVRCFGKVLTTLILFYDIKAAHDCLTSIVEELDERAAMMQRNNGEPPQRAWVE